MNCGQGAITKTKTGFFEDLCFSTVHFPRSHERILFYVAHNQLCRGYAYVPYIWDCRCISLLSITARLLFSLNSEGGNEPSDAATGN